LRTKAIPEGMNFQTITDAEREAFNEERDQAFSDAFNSHGVTAAMAEQERLFDTLIDPLAETIRNTAPTTVGGIAAKALYLLDHAHANGLTTKDMDSLDQGEEDLRQFIEQLAALA
jgi:hypothetical protein